jgi:hypothetical protein
LHTQTLLGIVPPWRNKSNIPCIRIWMVLIRLTVKHSEHVLCSNNFILDITCWETKCASLILEGIWGGKNNINKFRDQENEWYFMVLKLLQTWWLKKRILVRIVSARSCPLAIFCIRWSAVTHAL